MSRTKRRKNAQAECYYTFKSDSEFQYHRECWNKQPCEPVLKTERPKLTYDVGKEVWEEYWMQFRSEEWALFYAGRRYARWGYGQQEYNKYKKIELARFHAEMGAGREAMRHAPRWYVKAFITKPLRQKHREEIYRGVMFDEDCEVMLTSNKRCSSMYW